MAVLHREAGLHRPVEVGCVVCLPRLRRVAHLRPGHHELLDAKLELREGDDSITVDVEGVEEPLRLAETDVVPEAVQDDLNFLRGDNAVGDACSVQALELHLALRRPDGLVVHVGAERS